MGPQACRLLDAAHARRFHAFLSCCLDAGPVSAVRRRSRSGCGERSCSGGERRRRPQSSTKSSATRRQDTTLDRETDAGGVRRLQ
eukprot:6212296-Pleurochrysis_carterae.AAC.2